MKKNSLKVGLIQTSVTEDVDDNLKKTAHFIKQAARKGAEIVCLQELFADRYFAQVQDDRFFDIDEVVPGRLTHFLSECAATNHVHLIGGSIYEKGDDEKFYNTSLIFDSRGQMTGKYRK